jgi:beta-phosphoglucomutase-like phosphatase (HAD superfamily)
MLVLEDSQHGTRAALAAGACTIAVPGDHSRDHNFAGVFHVANTLADPRIKQLLVATATDPKNAEE